jgi:ribosome maturation factor RimP
LTLESPGVERDLSTLRQFRFAIGEQVRIVTRGEDAAVVEGRLSDVHEDTRVLDVTTADGVISIDTGVIKSARTIFDWDAQVGAKRKF